jgi:hypothetical protein
VSDIATPSLFAIFLVAAVATRVVGIFLSDSTEESATASTWARRSAPDPAGIAGTLPEIAITSSAAISRDLGVATPNSWVGRDADPGAGAARRQLAEPDPYSDGPDWAQDAPTA